MQTSLTEDNRRTHKRIRIRIPKLYRGEPVISRLVSDYGLTVNITAAILGANGVGDGWFDLDLHGRSPEIDSALIYLNELDLEVWHDQFADDECLDGW